MSYTERITAYFEAIAETWQRLSETEQEQFQAWKDLHPGSGNSEWPGWIAYLGVPPKRAQPSVLPGGYDGMKNHDNEATQYVCSLGPRDVTRAQKQCLLRIANHWTARYRMACLPNSDLCADLMIGERQLGRICQDLHRKGILDYRPGRGAGNWSQFRFPKLDLLATETRRKGVIFDTPNKERKPRLTSNTTHPNPPFQGGNQNFRSLTSRETKLLNERIAQLQSRQLTQYAGAKYDSQGSSMRKLDFAEALELACAQLMLPIESAWAAANAAGVGESRKKQPAKVSA